MLPEIDIPEVHTYEAIVQRARDKARRKTPQAVIAPTPDPTTMQAIAHAASEKIIAPIFVADRELLLRQADELGIAVDNFTVVNKPDNDAAVIEAAGMVKSKEADFIVQGHMAALRMLHILFTEDCGFRLRGRTISHVAVLKPRKYPKLLLLTDGAVVVQPDLKTKINLIGNLVFVSERIGVPNPRIAVIGAVEVVYPQMAATVDAAVLAKMAERKQIKGARVDGPLSFDVAIDMFAAHSKGITQSEVAGQADGMVTSTIEVANGVYNAMALYGQSQSGSVVVGGCAPLTINFRPDNEEARFNSIILAALTC